ncbi:MAG: GNAT family N-acetyltransferase [Alphaproteobacteria bacterium]
MTGLTIRRAEASDLPEIIAMLADDELGATREDASDPPNPAYLAAFEAISQDLNQFLAVGVVEGQVIGCLQLSFIPGLSHKGMWRGQIEGVRVHGDHRGSGLGSDLLRWAIDQCRAKGCGMVQLTTTNSRKKAQQLYQRLGLLPVIQV